MDPIVKCSKCGVKFRISPTALRALNEIPCAKCKAKVIIPAELKESLPPLPGATDDKPPASAASDEPATGAKDDATDKPELGIAQKTTTRTVTFACASCGKGMIVKTELSGKKVRCSSCRSVNVVPGPGVTEADKTPSPMDATDQAPTPPAVPPPAGAPAPDSPKTDTPTPSPPTRTPAAENDALEARVAALERRLHGLEQQITTLATALIAASQATTEAAKALTASGK